MARAIDSDAASERHRPCASLRRENALLEASWLAAVEATEVARRENSALQIRFGRLSRAWDTAVADAAALAQMLEVAISRSADLRMTPAIAALLSRCRRAAMQGIDPQVNASGTSSRAETGAGAGGSL